ncbi:hypothetical protein ET445_16600 [Agromyces protaetiae]|uniref:Glycosyltransferase n=1 Tax=Agromyces protaetiae TaxID=2509455 RepID=A0A4P6FFP1_9MICO|nr:glycosyltransferase family 4 protein [Agromyces protaetiae]QAY74715.1 hypothetical protein ET445_16600 [Agromyces protaetiae]
MTRARVLFLNNYPPREALRRVRAEEYPAQHLWGTWELQGDFEWEMAPRTTAELAARRPWIRRIANYMLPIFGDPLQELYAIRARCDVIYAADQQSVVGLAALKRLGLFRRPIVMVAHNGPRIAWTRWWMKAVDVVIVLSEPVKARLASQLGDSVQIEILTFGPSLDSPVYGFRHAEAMRELDFVAAGKSNREYSLLRKVAREQRLDGVIFTGRETEEYSRGNLTRTQGGATYTEVLGAMVRARWCVIPLKDPDRLSGLTEVADALALGTPVIVQGARGFAYALPTVYVDGNSDEALLAEHIRSDPPAMEQVLLDARSIEMSGYAKALKLLLESQFTIAAPQ